jgi:DNA-binding FrmR family transcriptional regulator
MQADTKASVLKRIKRVAGQLEGIGRMVEQERYCIDVVTQVLAVRAALKRIEEEVLQDHVGHCVAAAIRSGDRDEQRRKITELMDVFARAAR